MAEPTVRFAHGLPWVKCPVCGHDVVPSGSGWRQHEADHLAMKAGQSPGKSRDRQTTSPEGGDHGLV